MMPLIRGYETRLRSASRGGGAALRRGAARAMEPARTGAQA